MIHNSRLSCLLRDMEHHIEDMKSYIAVHISSSTQPT